MNCEYSKEKYVAGAMRLMEALSGVDQELLERCGRDVRTDTGKIGRINDRIVGDKTVSSGVRGVAAGRKEKSGRRHKRPFWQYTKAWAAVLCFAVVGALSWGGYILTEIVNKNTSGSGSNGAMQPEAMDLAAQDDGGQAEGAIEEQQCSNTAIKEEWNKFTDENSMKNTEDAGNAGSMVSDFSGSSDAKTAESEKLQNEAFEREEGVSADTMDGEACPILNVTEFSEEKAGNVKGLGDYLPTKLPGGYVFERAYSNQDMQDENLTVTWTRGMDSIMLHISLPESVPAVVDVSKPETYDERIYEIPYAQTVPEEYWESVNDPVFAWEDMSLEIVKSRMIAYEDRGDTNTPRGNFSILFSDGTAMRFNGRGTAEEIWEMLCSCVH